MIKKAIKFKLLGLYTLIAIVVTIMFKPVAQDLSYHQFADQRLIAGIPNFFNVLSNIPFLFVGIYGLCKWRKSNAPSSDNRMYAILFTGILLTGLVQLIIIMHQIIIHLYMIACP
jgi:hypothetical protein